MTSHRSSIGLHTARTLPHTRCVLRSSLLFSVSWWLLSSLMPSATTTKSFIRLFGAYRINTRSYVIRARHAIFSGCSFEEMSWVCARLPVACVADFFTVLDLTTKCDHESHTCERHSVVLTISKTKGELCVDVTFTRSLCSLRWPTLVRSLDLYEVPEPINRLIGDHERFDPLPSGHPTTISNVAIMSHLS